MQGFWLPLNQTLLSYMHHRTRPNPAILSNALQAARLYFRHCFIIFCFIFLFFIETTEWVTNVNLWCKYMLKKLYCKSMSFLFSFQINGVWIMCIVWIVTKNIRTVEYSCVQCCVGLCIKIFEQKSNFRKKK